MQTPAYIRSSHSRVSRDRRAARRVAMTLLCSTVIVLCGAAVAAAAEQLKIVLTPASLSLSAAENEGFTVTVSGTSGKRADMAVYYQLDRKSCAATGGQEATRKGDSQLVPIPGTPSDPQVFPRNPVNFRGAFDWHGELKVFSGEAGPGTYLLCGYLAPENSSGKPFLKTSAKFTLTAG